MVRSRRARRHTRSEAARNTASSEQRSYRPLPRPNGFTHLLHHLLNRRRLDNKDDIVLSSPAIACNPTLHSKSSHCYPTLLTVRWSCTVAMRPLIIHHIPSRSPTPSGDRNSSPSLSSYCKTTRFDTQSSPAPTR